MANDPSDRIELKELRALIAESVHGRGASRLEEIEKKIAGEEDPEKRDALELKRNKLQEDYSVGNWLDNASQRVRQIQTITHAVKFANPFARGVSLNVKRKPTGGASGLLATSAIAGTLKEDVVGNAAALDVYKFLQLEYDGRTLLDRILERDPALAAALSDSPEQAAALMEAFAGIVQSKSKPATDKLLRQLYFPLPDGDYHLLAPLYPTSLVHEVQSRMKECLFGADAKEARQAHKEAKPHSEGYRDYRDLAELKFGGSKPQNVSQLNSERGGQAWLLPLVSARLESANTEAAPGKERVRAEF